VGAAVIFLDSADPQHASEAAEMGFVQGVTTNPALIRAHGSDPFDTLRQLLAAWPGQIFYQPVALDYADIEQEARFAHTEAPGRLVIKLPARTDLLRLASHFGRDGIPCAATAVYTQSQLALAAAADCKWVIPYVDRARRLRPSEPSVVLQLAELAGTKSKMPDILAASIKSPEQAVRALLEGAAAITTSLDVIRSMADHELTQTAIDEFAAPWRQDVTDAQVRR
jgi:transaldolase